MYLCSPYSHTDAAVREARFQAACRYAAEMLRCGICVFSPIVHSHVLTGLGLPNDWEFWKRRDLGYLEACSGVAVLMLDGWKDSTGVQWEIATSRELGKPLIFIAPHEEGP